MSSGHECWGTGSQSRACPVSGAFVGSGDGAGYCRSPPWSHRLVGASCVPPVDTGEAAVIDAGDAAALNVASSKARQGSAGVAVHRRGQSRRRHHNAAPLNLVGLLEQGTPKAWSGRYVASPAFLDVRTGQALPARDGRSAKARRRQVPPVEGAGHVPWSTSPSAARVPPGHGCTRRSRGRRPGASEAECPCTWQTLVAEERGGDYAGRPYDCATERSIRFVRSNYEGSRARTQSEAPAAGGSRFGSRQSRTGTIVMPMKRLYARVDGKKPTSPPQSKTSQGSGL
jgi:hypothetical protein